MTKSETSRTRLLFFSFGILEQGGGFENYLITTARGLSERFSDLDVRVVTMDPKTVEKLQRLLSVYFFRKQDPKAIYRETLASVQHKLGAAVNYTRASSLKELARTLAASDVIYAKNEVLELGTLQLVGMKRLPPVIVGVHTPIYYPGADSLNTRLHNVVYTGPLYRRWLKRAREVQVNNAADLELVRTKLKVKSATIARQPFDVPELKDTPPHPDRLRILFAGRLSGQKGIPLLVRTIETLEREHPDRFDVRIAGSGDTAFVDQAERLARSNPHVRYLGHVENERIQELYEWTDITLITSSYETLSKVAAETALAGKIAVCTDISGPRELIKNEVTGFLLPPDHGVFVQQIAKLADMKKNDPEGFKRMGQAAYHYVKERFDAEKVYSSLHQAVLSASGRAQVAAEN